MSVSALSVYTKYVYIIEFAQKTCMPGQKRTSFDSPKLGDDLLEIRDSLVFGYSKFFDMRFSDSLPLTPQVCKVGSGFWLVGWLVGGLVGWLVGWFVGLFVCWLVGSSANLPDGLW